MPIHPLREDVGASPAPAGSRCDAPEPQSQDFSALMTDLQVRAALEVALELIEMRYQDHLARMALQSLFTDDGFRCV
jgi:hypothetical protein